MPDAAITTDVIVGFPGETEDDFAQTLEVVARSRFAGAFTFQYSVRPGTPAATMPDQVPPEVVAERYARLVEVVEQSAWSEAKTCVGSTVEVLVAEGEGRKDVATQRLSGRALDNRLVHVAACDARPGDVVRAVVSYAAPHHLVADEVLDTRRTRGGDAWQAQRESPAPTGVLLGMPGRPG
jgi:tRNA-2-methylthio-N6-dimethylallyladenosine synthase